MGQGSGTLGSWLLTGESARLQELVAPRFAVFSQQIMWTGMPTCLDVSGAPAPLLMGLDAVYAAILISAAMAGLA